MKIHRFYRVFTGNPGHLIPPRWPVYAVSTIARRSDRGKSNRIVQRLSSIEIKQAIQLVTLIVGKRNCSGKWCRVKTLTDEIDEAKSYQFYLTDENLVVSMEEASWIRYLKATIQCFKAKRGTQPFFKSYGESFVSSIDWFVGQRVQGAQKK